MNFSKKNSVKQELCKKGQKKKLPAIRYWFAGIIALAVILGALAWHYLPIYYARFYLTRSALLTKEQLKGLWGKGQEGGGADEECIKLIADEVKWNGHSVLVLPGGFGVSWKEQRNEENTFAQGSLDVYFLGAIRDGIHYWSDQENAVITVPGIMGTTIRTSQDALKKVIGFSLVPQKRNQLKDEFQTLKKDTIHMILQSAVDFEKRDENGVTIKAVVPSDLFDSYMSEIGDLLNEGPSKDMKEWGQMVKERKTQGETQEIVFSIDKWLHITEVHVEGLADMSLKLESNGGVSIAGTVRLNERALDVNTKIYFGNGQEGRRAFQIPELNITYLNERFRLELKLSGGYEAGKVSAGVLESGKLSETGGESASDGLKEIRDEFLKRSRQLGLEF